MYAAFFFTFHAAVEQDNCMGTVFHPELMPYTCFHEYFLEKSINEDLNIYIYIHIYII
ncbi:hypothetical protein [Plasmodium yoelii yoelii]|uniref:Uncharacterized protein n=1 Tax=Plasmodium yoelii yoelii TaxID=73239 RepID=Q7RMM2_PLAYO|nr:hypothetical protein [Plasmodium yoelii yoelii]